MYHDANYTNTDANATAMAATQLVALRMPVDYCLNFLSDLSRSSPDEPAHEPPRPTMFGEKDSNEFENLFSFAESYSNMKAEAPIRYAARYGHSEDHYHIVLYEEGTGMAHLIFPRPSEALYRLARLMADDMLYSQNGQAA